MNKQNEQLNQLLSQFMDGSHIREFQDDLSFADELYAKYPVRPVSQKILSAITTRVHRHIRYHRYWIAAKWGTATAAVVIGTFVAGLFLTSPEKPATHQPATYSQRTHDPAPDRQIWSDSFIVYAMETDSIERELNELTESVQAVPLDVYETRDTLEPLTIDLLEIQEIESLTENTNFWKG